MMLPATNSDIKNTTIIIAILMIYTYNIIVFPLGITIAFNVFTIILIGIFGLPAVVGLCLFSILIF